MSDRLACWLAGLSWMSTLSPKPELHSGVAWRQWQLHLPWHSFRPVAWKISSQQGQQGIHNGVLQAGATVRYAQLMAFQEESVPEAVDQIH